MGRFNKTIDGVFINLIGSETQISSYDKFIGYGKGIKSKNTDLERFSKEYKDMITKTKGTITKLAKLEEIIMQLRSIEDLSDIKLFLVREYLYARTPFYRLGKSNKDIRIIVDRSEFWEGTVDELINNNEFMTKAKEKLKTAMLTEVRDNISEYNKLK